MKTPTNRVLQAFSSWEERRKVAEPIVKNDVNAAGVLARLQLDHLRKAAHRLRGTVRPDEAPFLLLLQNRLRQLERQLQPNWLLRNLSRLKDLLLDGPRYLKRVAQEREVNISALNGQLKAMGLGGLAGRLQDHLVPEQAQVRLPLSLQFDADQRLALDLHFAQDVYGNFQLEKIGSVLQQGGQTQFAHEFRLAEWPNLRLNQVKSLLEGRALRQRYQDASGLEAQRWVELGPDGVRYYDQDNGLDLRKALADLPAITRNKDELVSYLENGQLIPTHWKQGRHYVRINVQADPGNKTLKLFDEQLRPTTAAHLDQQIAKLGTKVRTLGNERPKKERSKRHRQHQ